MTDTAATPRVARILPDVSGIDKRFDYLVPAEMAARVEIGTRVRIGLHGRRVGGWVTALDPVVAHSGELKPIAKVTGHGPSAEVIELAEWAALRWAARRTGSLLVTASPNTATAELPPARRTGAAPAPSSPATRRLLSSGGGVLRLPPLTDLLPALFSAAAFGPCLVVSPNQSESALLAVRLRRAGLSVALLPDDWGSAAAGVDVVIGGRAAAWGPCPQMAAAVLLDEHDEALQEERSPTWHARDVLSERCRRAGVPFIAVSPAPTLVSVTTLAGTGGVLHPPPARERAGWPRVEVVDRRDEEPWRRSLVTSGLIEHLRARDRRVVCVSNTTGRARVMACRSCRALLRCEKCDAAVAMDDDGNLDCTRCSTVRPPVCQQCGAGRFANLRPGVTRLREELEAAAARPVAAVTGNSDEPPADVPILVGTEAVLHRSRPADVVAFLEFDSEMLAPRYRAGEQALALLIRAGRLAPHVMVQTFVPDHPVIRAAATGDPEILVEVERERRAMLSLPPFGALAAVSGTALEEFLDELPSADVTIGRDGDRALVRAPNWDTLATALAIPDRPDGNHLRIEVDPPRL